MYGCISAELSSATSHVYQTKTDQFNPQDPDLE